MRIRVLSDLHLEFHPWDPPPAPCDLVILAGDIGAGSAGPHWADRSFPGQRVVYVPGNHELYGFDVHDLACAPGMRGNVALLDCASLDGRLPDGQAVRVLGATLWTDFNLYGDPLVSMALSKAGMYDYRAIRYQGRLLQPEDTLAEHKRCVTWLQDRLAEPFDGKTVVVTHHGPSLRSVHERYAGNPINGAFASNLDHLVEQADLWVHGHTHTSFDYVIGDKPGKGRVVCNPRGYPTNTGGENPDFDPTLVVEI